MKKRSITIAGHATSLWLETDFWEALKEIAAKRGMALNQLVAEIDTQSRPEDSSTEDSANLSSTLRLFVLRYYRDQLRALSISPPPSLD